MGSVAAVVAPPAADASPGDVDPTFGTAGSTIIELPGSQQAVDVAVAEDGSVFAAGWVYAPYFADSEFVLAKLTPSGVPDEQFGEGGIVTRSGFQPTDLALSGSGDVLATGYTGVNPGVFRFDETGEPEAGFGGGDGFVGTAGGEALAELPSGDIVVLGNDFALTKLYENGDVDGSFASEATDLPNPDANALVLLSNGGIAAAGIASQDAWGYDVAVAVFDADGALRDEFAGDGAELYPAVGCCQALVDAIDSHGGLLFVFGSVFEETHGFSGGLVAAFKADGSLDNGFANEGWQSRGLGEYNGFDGGFVTDRAVVATGSVQSAYSPGEVDWPDTFLFGVGHDGLPTAGFPGDGRFDSDVNDLPNYGGPSAAGPGDDLFVILAKLYQPGGSEPEADLVLTRFELSSDFEDRDGDSIGDGADSCLLAYGPSPSGCLRHERSLEIDKRYGDIRVSAVRADGSTVACSNDERIVLQRMARHGRKRVMVAHFDEFYCQKEFFYTPKRPGSVSAFVKSNTEPRVGHLSRARSAWLEVSPETKR